MKDEELLRYSRQIVLPEVDIDGQKKIEKSKVLIIGLGGLGSVTANYLCRAGIGELTVCDYDEIDVSNLHRQILFNDEDIGLKKTAVTKKRLGSANPKIKVKTIQEKLDKKKLDLLLRKELIVVDSTDNFQARYALNEICFKYKRPLISGSAIGWKGQLLRLNFSDKESPCYECLYGSNMKEDESCSESGILAPVTGLIGCLQALEVIKLILNEGNSSGSLIEFDGLSNQSRILKVKKDPGCRVCS
tara:strand:+ start:7162 stop:7899 length:738 start_codon:yes stop_codon:yes gene_type:complete